MPTRSLLFLVLSVWGVFPTSTVWASDFYNKSLAQCQANDRSSHFYNCTCFAKKYVKLRSSGMEDGSARLKLKNECLSAEGIKVYQKRNCLKNTFGMPEGINHEAYCNCIAETFTQKYLQSPNPTTQKNEMEAGGKALQECKK